MKKTWEDIVIPENPIALPELEILIAQGDPLTFPPERADLYKQALNYWNRQLENQTLLRAKELSEAIVANDEAKVRRMTRQIAGDNPRFRMTSAHLEGKRLYLALNATNYELHIGTNGQALVDPVFRQALMTAGIEDRADPNFYFSNPLGACTILHGMADSGEYFVITKRSKQVMIDPDKYHVFGGVVEYIEGAKGMNFTANILKELEEEVGLGSGQISTPMFQGLIRHATSRHPEMIISSELKISSEELEERWRKSSARYESKRISYIPLSKIDAFMEKYGGSETMVESCAAAVSLLLPQLRKG